MKIGIVTFFCVPNYGAMLQAYALWKYLEGRGHDVEFIDYDFCRTEVPLFVRCFVARRISAIRNRLKVYFGREMLKFAETFPMTRRYSSYKQLVSLCPKYDYVIVGSDQMWNPKWVFGDRLRFVMLDFVGATCQRLACSVSFGTDKWPADKGYELAGEQMRRFAAISVRECGGIELVKKISGREDVQCLIDPTMLNSADSYLKLIGIRNENAESQYVFEYFIEHSSDERSRYSVAEKVKSELGISAVLSDRVSVCGMMYPLCRLFGITSRRSVEDWLACISKASFVCTNSFHGTVFSLLFHRPFVSVLLNGEMAGMNERIVSLLTKLGLEYRLVHANEESRVNEIVKRQIDWGRVDSLLEKERVRYSSFLDSVGL